MTGTYGQDWASYQDAAPATAGLGFVFVKATEGTGYANPLHAAQIAHARAAGLVVGHYHYPHMAADPATEADRFLAVAQPQPGDVLVLDWEGYDPANKGVPFARQIAYKAAFLAHVAAAMPHRQVGTYCNTDYLDRDPGGQYGDFLWIATANRPAGSPGISHNWLFHQYGATGVDRDYCPLTPAQLKTWAHAKENNAVATLDKEDIAAVAAAVTGAVWGAQFPSPTAPPGPSANRSASAFLRWGDQHAVDILNAVKSQPAPALSDVQLTAIATKVAASPVLAAAIAEQVAVKLAARLQS